MSIGLKPLWENKGRIILTKGLSKKYNRSLRNENPFIRLASPTNERACVFQIETKFVLPVVVSNVSTEKIWKIRRSRWFSCFWFARRFNTKSWVIWLAYATTFLNSLMIALGMAIGTEHNKKINENPLSKFAPNEVALYKIPSFQEEIKEILDKSDIFPSKFRKCGPAVLVLRKNGTNKICIKVTKIWRNERNNNGWSTSSSVSSIGQRIEALRGAACFLSLD